MPVVESAVCVSKEVGGSFFFLQEESQAAKVINLDFYYFIATANYSIEISNLLFPPVSDEKMVVRRRVCMYV